MDNTATDASLIEAKAELAARDPAALDELLAAVGPARIPQPVREESAAALKLLATRHPEALAPRLDELIEMLDSDNAFTRMALVQVIRNLACADRSLPLEVLIDRMLGHLSDMVSVACHVPMAAATVAKGSPALEQKVTARILDIPRVAARPERIDLMRSYAIEALETYLAPEARTEEVVAFVAAGLEGDSPKTRKLAADTLRRWGVSAPRPGR